MSAKPKKAKVAIKTMIDRVYKNGFIFVAWDPIEVNKYFVEQDVDFDVSDEDLDGVCASKGADHYIYLKELEIGVLVHECVHAAQASMEYRGIETWNNNTEITAYLTQWIFDNSNMFYIKYFAKLKKNEK